jgi:uncharacterized membrane protein YoaK (UPF0700 family)
MLNYFSEKIKRFRLGDFSVLKTCCLVIGMILGAYVSNFVKENLYVFIMIAVVTMLWLVVRIFKK